MSAGDWWDRDVFQQGHDSCVSSQDVPYPVEAVIQAGGYVVHQVTATDHLKTGDQVQLHLDQVQINFLFGGDERRSGDTWRPGLDSSTHPGPQTGLHGEAHWDPHPQLRSEERPGSHSPAEGVPRLSGPPAL